ncbi:MAG: hypothetical protein DI573_11025 [Microbacterium sp.]|nr:MAG: hypothetical protein DI573_11025 [Microbacterium sp.]
MTDTPTAGWYPAPHANNEIRYWDGQRWAESAPPAAAHTTTLTEHAPSGSGPSPSRGQAKGLAITALVLGIVAFLTSLIPWLGLAVAVAAVVLGIFALAKRQPKGMAVTGLALGGIALIAALVITVAFSAFVSTASTSSASVAEVGDESANAADTEGDAVAGAPDAEQSAAEPSDAEPEQPSADGTAQNPLSQPYVAEGWLGGENYSLTGRIMDPNANALVEGWNQFNSDAPAGFKYVVVELTMTGINPDGVEPSLAELDLYLATDEGNRYSSEFIVLGDGMASMSDGPTLYPGSVFTGYTAYIVPEAAQSFMLYDNGRYISF